MIEVQNVEPNTASMYIDQVVLNGQSVPKIIIFPPPFPASAVGSRANNIKTDSPCATITGLAVRPHLSFVALAVCPVRLSWIEQTGI